MNPGKPNKPDAQEPGRDLDEVANAYRQLGSDEPPAMLDQAVLNEARREVKGEAHPIRPWNFGWIHATATAALLVIGLTVVLQHRSELPEPPVEPKESPVNVLENRQRAAGPESLADSADQAPADERMDSPATEPAAPATAAAYEMEEAIRAPAEDALEKDTAPSHSVTGEMAARKMSPPAKAETMLDPESWLEAILDMKATGDDGWRAELDAFIAVYPDHPLPPELQAAVRADSEENPDAG